MKEDLDLSGVALQVYALIYSFTKAGGDCHASLNNMAKRVGASSRSVQRALIELTAKGYIIKKTSNQASSNRYIADLSVVGQNVQGGRTKCLEGDDKMSNNNKEDNKEDNNTNLLTNHSLFQGKPRPIQPFGREKVVMMTLHQYANLLRAIGVMPTRRYIAVLERQIRKFSAKAYKDHYQTIIGWARKDGLVTPEGEEILIN
jgi:DNA-binding transcriptional MocR family regulator